MIDHGILTEESTMRVHLSTRTGFIYAYPTAAAREMAESGRWFAFDKTVGDMGEESTGAGFVVPLWGVPSLHAARWKKLCADHERVLALTQSAKGAYAVEKVVLLIEAGYLGFLGRRIERIVTDKATQIRGVDVITDKEWLEVKYDEPAGPGAYGGSGKLFIQYAERNPHKSH